MIYARAIKHMIWLSTRRLSTVPRIRCRTPAIWSLSTMATPNYRRRILHHNSIHPGSPSHVHPGHLTPSTASVTNYFVLDYIFPCAA